MEPALHETAASCCPEVSNRWQCVGAGASHPHRLRGDLRRRARAKDRSNCYSTHGYTGYKRAFLGSTAERFVHIRPVRFLSSVSTSGLFDPRTRTGFRLRTILVPTDFSECSRIGSDYGLQLARDFGAELRLVHVINPNAFPFGDKYTALDPTQLLQEMEDAAQKRMRSMAAIAKARYSVLLIHGSPAVEISARRMKTPI